MHKLKKNQETVSPVFAPTGIEAREKVPSPQTALFRPRRLDPMSQRLQLLLSYFKILDQPLF